MSLKEKLNANPNLGIFAGVGLLGVAIASAYFFGAFGGGSENGPDRVFFSDDDGTTYFPDDARKVPPFDRGGKQAVRAYVFECGGTPFVNHLERFTPEGQKIASGSPADRSSKSANIVITEIKKPGVGIWVPSNDKQKAGPVLMVRCPDGRGNAKPLLP